MACENVTRSFCRRQVPFWLCSFFTFVVLSLQGTLLASTFTVSNSSNSWIARRAMAESIWSQTTREKPDEKQSERREPFEDRDDPDRELFVSKDSKSRTIAFAIATRIRRYGRAVVRAVGALSVNQAIKAVAHADQIFSRRAGPASIGYGLATMPHFKLVQKSEDDDPANVLVLEIYLMKRPKQVLEVDSDRQISAAKEEEDMPKMAASIKKGLNEVGVAVVTCMGARKINRSLKAALQAGRYIRDDQGRRNEEFKPVVAVFPSFYEFAPKDGKKASTGSMLGLRLDCIAVDDNDDVSASSAKVAASIASTLEKQREKEKTLLEKKLPESRQAD